MEKKIKNKEKKISKKVEQNKKHMFNSKAEYIDYAFGSDPILCQALKNCIDDNE